MKLETGRHLFYHADAAHALRERLHEQEKTLAQVDAFRDAEIDRFIDEVLSAADAAELLVGIHQVAGMALATAYRHHADDTDPVTDVPTIRVLRRILLDYEPMLAWADAALAAYVAGGIDESRLARWRWHLARLLASIGGVTGERPTTLPGARAAAQRRAALRARRRGRSAMRVSSRLPTPAIMTWPTASRVIRPAPTKTCDCDSCARSATRSTPSRPSARFLWDIRFRDFQAEYDLARITWDEARHTEIGHRTLLAAGYDPFELPNRLTGSTCRGPMEPAYAMAEINLFGEVGVLKTIGSLINVAAERHDDLLYHAADFIRSDERTHVRKGRHIIRVMTDLGSQQLEQRTRELFTECLVSLGIVHPRHGRVHRLARRHRVPGRRMKPLDPIGNLVVGCSSLGSTAPRIIKVLGGAKMGNTDLRLRLRIRIRGRGFFPLSHGPP